MTFFYFWGGAATASLWNREVPNDEKWVNECTLILISATLTKKVLAWTINLELGLSYSLHIITFLTHYIQINTIPLILITWCLKVNCCCRKNGKWPNAYTFSEAVAEDIIQKLSGRLSVAIFRPSLGEWQICCLYPSHVKAHETYRLL